MLKRHNNAGNYNIIAAFYKKNSFLFIYGYIIKFVICFDFIMSKVLTLTNKSPCKHHRSNISNRKTCWFVASSVCAQSALDTFFDFYFTNIPTEKQIEDKSIRRSRGLNIEPIEQSIAHHNSPQSTTEVKTLAVTGALQSAFNG